MLITIPKVLETDIMNFVKLNNIEDINNFLVICLRDGFNIAKYGVSPQDNFNKENKPIEIEKYEAEEKVDTSSLEGKEVKRRGRPRKQQPKEEESIIHEKKEVLKPKKTIRIIKK